MAGTGPEAELRLIGGVAEPPSHSHLGPATRTSGGWHVGPGGLAWERRREEGGARGAEGVDVDYALLHTRGAPAEALSQLRLGDVGQGFRRAECAGSPKASRAVILPRNVSPRRGMSGQSIRIGRHDSCDGLPRVITLSETRPDAGAGRALERPRTPLHVTAADAPRRYRRTLCGSYLRAASTSHHLRRARLVNCIGSKTAAHRTRSGGPTLMEPRSRPWCSSP